MSLFIFFLICEIYCTLSNQQHEKELKETITRINRFAAGNLSIHGI